MTVEYNPQPYLDAYKNRTDPTQLQRTAWTDQSQQNATVGENGMTTYSMPWQDNMFKGTYNAQTGMMDYSLNTPTKTWADYTYERNPEGIMNQQRLAGWNQIANSTGFGGYGGLGVDAPINGTDADKIAFMDLLDLLGTHQASVQDAQSPDFMRDYGWAVPLALAGGVAAATGGFGGLAGGAASGIDGAAATTFGEWMPGMTGGADFAGLSASELAGLPGAASGAGGLGGVDYGLANGLDVGVPGAGTGPGGVTGPDFGIPGTGNGGVLDTVKSVFGNTPPGTGSVLKNVLSGVNNLTQDPNSGGLDWSRLLTGGLSSVLDQRGQNQLMDRYDAIFNSINQNQFPFRDFQSMAYDWKDPNKRYQMMLDSPAYRASSAYADQAQHRRNSMTGDRDSGYGDQLRADAIGKNALDWDKNMFDQISKMSGMGFNNAGALGEFARGLPQLFDRQSGINMDIGTTLAKSGLLPYILNKAGGMFDLGGIFGDSVPTGAEGGVSDIMDWMFGD